MHTQPCQGEPEESPGIGSEPETAGFNGVAAGRIPIYDLTMPLCPAGGRDTPTLNAVDIAYVLSLEALALRVTAAFVGRGIDVLLLKGPVTNRWLYGDALARRFRDIDLLVAPRRANDAEAVLAGLDFRNDHATVLGIFRPDYENSWTSSVGSIDLHTRLAGIPARRADTAWERLWQDASDFELHGHTIRTLSPAARTMLLGLHAARSTDDAQAMRDLQVGLAVLSKAQWAEATALADDLDAAASFALGLHSDPAGRTLLSGLGVTSTRTLESIILERNPPQGVRVIAAHFEAGGHVTPAVLHGWFTTEGQRRPPIRTVAIALARFPRALLTVLRAKRSLRREKTSALTLS